jgi:membrane protease YdiL (CAAX protease family)
MEIPAVLPAPDPPELPDGADRPPLWPPAYAVLAFFVGLLATVLAVGIVAAATGTASGEQTPAFTIFATLLQSAIFVGTAVAFASLTRRPRAWHFGLRRTRLWPAVGWAALGIFSYYVFAAAYATAVDPDAEQGITESLGADEGTLGMIAAGFMVVVVAPAAEEFFFRGFFYRALRTRFPVLVAAVVDGALFGAIHYDFSGGEAVLLVPPLAMLGVVFCLVYERTGSLYPVIALHAVNNAIAFGYQADAWEVSAVLGPVMIAACVIAPRLMGPPRPAPSLP